MLTPARDEGKVAILTGAAGGLGRAMTLGLLDAGWRVLAVDRGGAGLEALALAAQPYEAKRHLDCMPIDLTEDASATAVIARALQSFGRIDALINNAGLNMMSHMNSRVTLRPKFWEVEPAVFRLFNEINVVVPFRLCAAVVPHMLAAGSGRIVNVTTSLGSMLSAGMTPYAQSKASAESLSAVMAADLEGTGITVNVIVPGGPVDTPMVGDYPPMPRDRYLQPDVMVPPLLWLLSDEAMVSGMRYIARLWDPQLDPARAAAMAGAPVAWSSIAGEKWLPAAN